MMNTLLINKENQASPKAASGLALLLITLFLLTTCPIKGSLSILLSGKTSIENFGLNNHKIVSGNKTSVVAGDKVCSATVGVSSVTAEIPPREASSTFMATCLVYLFFLPAFSFRSLLLKELAGYSSKTTFSSGQSPIYIRDRRLLI